MGANAPHAIAMQSGVASSHQFIVCKIGDVVHLYDQNEAPSPEILECLNTRVPIVVYHPFEPPGGSIYHTDAYKDNWCSYFTSAWLDMNIRPDASGDLNVNQLQLLNRNFTTYYGL